MRPLNDSRLRLALGVVVVLLVALGLRWGHLAALRSSLEGTSLFATPRVDAEHHWREAVEILDAGLRPLPRVPWKPPGYSWFLAGLAGIFGRSPGLLRWPHAFLGALNCAGLVLLARRVLPAGWSALAGLLAATNGVLILFDGELYQPTLLIALGLLAMLLVARDDAGPRSHAAAGAVLGLAALVHASCLIQLVLLAAWAARKRAAHAVLLVAGALAAIAPLALTNTFVRGQPVAISWNGGINLYAANHPTFDQRAGNGTYAWGRLVRAPVDAGIEGEADRDRLYRKLAVRQALAYPGETAIGLLRKAWIFFSPIEIANNFRIYELRGHSAVLRGTLGHLGPLWLPFGVWAPLALAGLWVSWRDRSAASVVLLLWILGIFLSNVLFFNTARYRAPAVFFGCIWVALACRAGWSAWGERRLAALAKGVLACAAVAASIAAGAVPQRTLPPPLEFYEALARTPGGSFEDARAWAERAIAKDPDSPLLLQYVSDLYARWGRRDLQRDLLTRLLALPDLEPDLVDLAHDRMGQSLAADGRLAEARRSFERALAVRSDAATWRGYPYYQLGLPPVRSCLLRLDLAWVDRQLGDEASARGLAAAVRADCPPAGEIAARLARLRL